MVIFIFVVLETEPRALHMLGTCSVTKGVLVLLPFRTVLVQFYYQCSQGRQPSFPPHFLLFSFSPGRSLYYNAMNKTQTGDNLCNWSSLIKV